MPLYTYRATFDEYSPPVTASDDTDDEWLETSGWCDPANPWGGWDNEDEPIPVTFDSLSDAVNFAVEFPGAIWNYSECDSEQNYRTGVYRSVTLHIDEKDFEQITKWVRIIERIQAKRLRDRAKALGWY